EAVRWRAVLVGDARGAIVAHRDAVAAPGVDRRHIVGEVSAWVDCLRRLLPGHPAVGRLAQDDVELAEAIVLPDGIDIAVPLVHPDTWEVVGADEGAGDALLGAAPDVARRLVHDHIVADLRRPAPGRAAVV